VEKALGGVQPAAGANPLAGSGEMGVKTGTGELPM
jgi:hypothetical protein